MNVAIVGSGAIALAYLKVVRSLGYSPIVIGRSQEKIDLISEANPGVEVHAGGIEKNLPSLKARIRWAILATPIPMLMHHSKLLVDAGVQTVLVEKPLSFYSSQVEELQRICKKNGANIYVAFNRRHFASIKKCREMINEEGGLISIHFDFSEVTTERSRGKFPDEVLHHWGIANSSHIIDAAFHLAGLPALLSPKIYKENSLKWHPSGTIYIGEGLSQNGVPFSYNANWASPGRWSIELKTAERGYILSPMEKLKVQQRGSFDIQEADVDYSKDQEYKPGFYCQTRSFLVGDEQSLVSLNYYLALLEFLKLIFNYRL